MLFVEGLIERVGITIRFYVAVSLQLDVIEPFHVGENSLMSVGQLFFKLVVGLRIVIGFVIFVVVTIKFNAVFATVVTAV